MIAAEIFALLLAVIAAPQDLGKRIYTTGTSPAGTIRAAMGDGETVVASVVPCASCHGADGRGRAEGGAVPSDIRRETLTRPYSVTSPSQRRHGPYDDRSLLRAITMGIDSAGNPLSNVMPRYQLARADAAALLAFLSTLGAQRDPGLTDDTVTIGVLLPPSEDAAAGVRASLTAWIDDVNKSGGIFDRRIAIRFAQPGSGTADRVDKLQDLAQTFALVAADTEGAEEQLAAAAEKLEIPLLTTISRMPANGRGGYRFVFELFAGVENQNRVLLRAATEDGRSRPLLIVGGSEALAADARRLGFTHVELIQTAAVPDTIRRARPDSLLLVAAPLAHPIVFSEDNPLRTYVAFPTLPSDRSPRAQAALASAALFVDAMRRAGRDVSRASLIDALDTTAQLSTGFAPPVSFSATHRIGSTGAYIVVIEHGKTAPARWMD
jgi:mono/diheme cytochrome c family protein